MSDTAQMKHGNYQFRINELTDALVIANRRIAELEAQLAELKLNANLVQVLAIEEDNRRLEKENADWRERNEKLTVFATDHLLLLCERDQLRAQVARLREAVLMWEPWYDKAIALTHLKRVAKESPQDAAKELLGPTLELLRVLRRDPWRNDERIDREIERIERVLG